MASMQQIRVGPQAAWKARGLTGSWIPSLLPLLLTLDTACVYLKQGRGALEGFFVPALEKGRRLEPCGEKGERQEGGGGAVRSKEEGRLHKYSEGALNGKREIKQMEFVLKNGTITLF